MAHLRRGVVWIVILNEVVASKGMSEGVPWDIDIGSFLKPIIVLPQIPFSPTKQHQTFTWGCQHLLAIMFQRRGQLHPAFRVGRLPRINVELTLVQPDVVPLQPLRLR